MTTQRSSLFRNVSFPGLLLTVGLVLMVPLVVGVTWWLTGNDSAESGLKPAPSVSQSGDTGTAAPEPPPIPEAAQQMTEDGAKAFVQYWFDVMDWTYASRSTELFASLGELETCSACQFALDDVSEMTKKGEFTKGANWTVTRYETKEFRPDGSGYVFAVTLKSDAEIVTDSADAVLRTNPPRTNVQREVAVVWELDHWLMSQTAQGAG